MIKNIIYCIIATLVVLVGYKVYNNQTADFGSPASIESIKQMVKLNAMELTDEVVYCDTIDKIGFVYAMEVRIIIGFDIENLKWRNDSGKIVVSMPEPIVETYQTNKAHCLDVYYINPVKDFVLTPNISSTMSLRIHKQLVEYIDKEVVRRNYADKARKTAFDNLQKLFSAMNVTIVDECLTNQQDTTEQTMPD